MKNRSYYNVTVHTHYGTTFSNPLKLSESNLIGKLAQEHKKIEVQVQGCSDEQYKLMFG